MIEKWRCFLAVTPGQDVIRRVREVVRELEPACLEAGQKVRWVHPSKVHLTLRFLGDIPSPLASSLLDAMKELDTVRRFDVSFEGLGAFPDAGRPRVVWMGVVDPEGWLAGLHSRVATMLERCGIPPESRPFAPHVTLGRVRDPSAGDLGPALAPREGEVFGSMQVSRVILYRSTLDRAGAIHEAMGSVELGRERAPRGRSAEGQE